MNNKSSVQIFNNRSVRVSENDRKEDMNSCITQAK